MAPAHPSLTLRSVTFCGLDRACRFSSEFLHACQNMTRRCPSCRSYIFGIALRCIPGAYRNYRTRTPTDQRACVLRTERECERDFAHSRTPNRGGFYSSHPDQHRTVSAQPRLHPREPSDDSEFCISLRRCVVFGEEQSFQTVILAIAGGQLEARSSAESKHICESRISSGLHQFFDAFASTLPNRL